LFWHRKDPRNLLTGVAESASMRLKVAVAVLALDIRSVFKCLGRGLVKWLRWTDNA